MSDAPEILTVGHSTHPIERFVALLRRAGVEAIADVRRYPGSRRNPQFGTEALADSLAGAGIAYEPLGSELGGRRRGGESSRNAGWRSASFRAYADHMASTDFTHGLERLEKLARERRSAVMCAESHPSRCHRQLIADALLARGWRVLHLLADGSVSEHALTPFALVEDAAVSYPGQPRLDV